MPVTECYLFPCRIKTELSMCRVNKEIHNLFLFGEIGRVTTDPCSPVYPIFIQGILNTSIMSCPWKMLNFLLPHSSLERINKGLGTLRGHTEMRENAEQ